MCSGRDSVFRRGGVSKAIDEEKILRVILGLAIAAVPSLRGGESSRVSNAIPPILVRQALAKNPELNFYAAEIAAAKGGLKTAGTIRNPEFNTQAGYKNTRDNSGGPSGDGAAWSVSVNQTFEYPGRIALRKAIAQGDIELAGASPRAVPAHARRASSDAGLQHRDCAGKVGSHA